MGRLLRNGQPSHVSVVAVVSHPHARKKHVSIGRREAGAEGKEQMAVKYNAATCNGSSGGLVLNADISDGIISSITDGKHSPVHPHSGDLGEGVGISADYRTYVGNPNDSASAITRWILWGLGVLYIILRQGTPTFAPRL